MAKKTRSGRGGSNRTPRVGTRAALAARANTAGPWDKRGRGIPAAARESAAMSAAAGSSNEAS